MYCTFSVQLHCLYTVFVTNLLHSFIVVINYCSDMFRPQFSAIFRQLASLSAHAAYVSTYVGQTAHIGVQI